MTKKILFPVIFMLNSLWINAQVVPLNHLEYLRKADLAALCDYMTTFGFKFFTLVMPDTANYGVISFYYPKQFDGKEKAIAWIHQYFHVGVPLRAEYKIASPVVYQQYIDSLNANSWVQYSRIEQAGLTKTVYMGLDQVLVIVEYPYPDPETIAYNFELWQKDAYLFEFENDIKQP